ncbi:STY4851/ECs_5259 family protein [Geomonas oryzae]|uniref:STY4851/ECs_5259 family protein n=1 Tax=Geomonas oryzae TaxID=2364273 RepID=UPI00100B6C14|nr:STY4851/ECs_5259 family protein [Geomonas oryzae]
MSSVFQSHITNLLNSRGLNAPDGRPLYDYRLTDEEFSTLETFLKEYLRKFGRFSNTPLDIIKDASGFPALFVLYAAEWWRRRYNGSGFSWEPILHDLDVDSDCWSHTQRSACVSTGIRDWQLPLRTTGGLRYLGTIALQGGLPMHLLVQARGNLGRILRIVLKEATRSTASSTDIQGWVISLNQYLPRTYRQAEIYLLLAEVVITVLRLKDEAGLTQSAGAIAQLENRIPSWRERFPLPVGDADAQKLIEQLIQDAVTAKVERQSRLCMVERFLEQGQDGRWHLCSRVTLPDSADVAKVGSLFGLESSLLPRMMDFVLEVNGTEQTTTMRKLAGHDKYRIDRCLWNVSNSDSAEEHVLRLSAPDGRSWSTTGFRGESLDQDLPWVFDAGDEVNALVRQGSGAVATSEAFVALPPRWDVSAMEEDIPIFEGVLHQFERKVFRVRGTACFSLNDAVCRVRTGRADAKLETYEWRGQRLWGEFTRPSMAFLGVPKLFKIDENGGAQQMAGAFGWRPIGTRGLVGTNPSGPAEMWYPAAGEVKFRSRMVILPPNAKTTMDFTDARSGEIRLENWGAISAVLVTTGVSSSVIRNSNYLSIGLKVAGSDSVPEWVELDVFWSQTPVPARVRLPYPAQGARAFDAKGRELQSGSLLSANRLLGVRILCLSGSQACSKRISLEFRLSGNGKGSLFSLLMADQSLHVEIRLQDYASEIAQLLATDDRPDASVEAIVRIGSAISARLRIARYESRLVRENGRVSLDASGFRGISEDALIELPVMAMRLDFPGEDAVRLSGFTSEGVATGAWEFNPQQREPGSWLIFPREDASLSFRPTIWPVDGYATTEGLIATAIGIPQEVPRVMALDKAIQTISGDFLDNGWADVERLVTQLGHLPLVTLDIWRCFARSAHGMAALVIRFSSLPISFVERFASELPFVWETVPFTAWLVAMTNLKRQCDAWYGTAGATVFTSHLDNRIAELTSYHPALYTILGVARAAATGDTPPEIQLFRKLGVDSMGGFLFSGDDCPFQQLLRNHADTDNTCIEWPTYFKNGKLRTPNYATYSSFFCKQDLGFQYGVVNLPIFLAAQVATDDCEEWFGDPDLVHELRKHIAFDPDWFTEAYYWTVARCVAGGLLNIEEKQ